MAKKKILSLVAALTFVCACTGQGILPPMPVDVIDIDADMVVGSTDQDTGDIPIKYTLYVTNIGDQALEKVILKDFQPPSDIVMKKEYFEIMNLGAGETAEITFDVIVLGWGFSPEEEEQWMVDFTIRIEEGSAYTENEFQYGIELFV